MCTETEAEMARGEELARAIVEHLERMGRAESFTTPVETRGVQYSVFVKITKIDAVVDEWESDESGLMFELGGDCAEDR